MIFHWDIHMVMAARIVLMEVLSRLDLKLMKMCLG